MFRFGFLFLLGFGCMFICEGTIFSSNGTNVTVTPGSTERIVWSFDDKIESFTTQLWTFIPSNGQGQEGLAEIRGSGDAQKLTSLYDVAVEKPATLVLKNVNLTYNGTYRFSLPSSSPSEVVVYIAVKPTATACSSRIMVNESGNVSCACQGQDGNPPADVTWYDKDGNKIGETGKEEKTLILTNVSEKHRGNYTCVAQSYPSELFRDDVIVEVIVNLNYKPTKPGITLPDKNIAFLGAKFTIRCVADGLPEPSYMITHNGTLVSNEPTYSKLTEWNDAGMYTCNATNKLGTNSSSATLIVQEKPPTQSTTQSATQSSTQSTTQSSSKSSERPPHVDNDSSGGLGTGAIVGICLGVLVLLVIVIVAVYFCNKSKEKDGRNRGNIDPIAGNHYELENEEPSPADNAYDTVGPAGESGRKKKAPEKDSLPPVYAAVDKNNRQGNTLYASLDTDALKRESKKEPERTPQTEYASIDFAKPTDVPKADLV